MKFSSIFILFLSVTLTMAQSKIKFATLAPDGSTWMNVMNDFSESLKKRTNGEVEFKIYAGGIQGDEKDVIRKIRIGQLHSGGFTGVGLGTILPESRILDTPFLFRSKDEVDYIAKKFFDRFSKGFEDKGYILLGWAEVGWVYIYTNKAISGVDDMKGVKMWMWEGDPIAKATFEAFNVSAIPLSITDVLTSLQTGLIDGVYTSPLANVALQWFTKVKYVLDLPLANSNGAVLVSKKMFNKLTPEQQKILREEGTKYFSQLTSLSRQDNVTSQKTMSDYGMVKTELKDPAVIKQFEEMGKKARQLLVGELYDQALLNDVESALSEYRKTKSN
ncbi:MAG: TRAP transporter substrate-binding protein DctP [Calditrichae bacterium]|nr:TRAP transporter substrate-binding protein DctP [Calditrichia bacterium]